MNWGELLLTKRLASTFSRPTIGNDVARNRASGVGRWRTSFRQRIENMTCIVGVAHEGRVWIGADSAGVAGYDLTIRADRKVFRNGPFVMGFTTSFRMGQLLAVKLTPPHYHPDVDVWRYMVGDFTESVRACLKTGGYAKMENGVESGGHFLVGFRGRLFKVESDFQVGESTNGFAATGCGESFALGSLAETAHLPPRKRVERALATAEQFCVGVKGPFHTEELKA